MTQTLTDSGTEFTISRTFDAPLARVWEVWTQPHHFEHWFHAAPGSVELDVRPDGAWSARLETPHGDMVLTGHYREVDPYKKLVWTLDMPDEQVVMHATFTDRGAQTEIVYGQNVVGPFTCEQAIEGATGIHDSLAEYLAQLG